MTQSSVGVKREDVLVIFDDFKLISSEYKVQNDQRMKCNQKTRKKCTSRPDTF